MLGTYSFSNEAGQGSGNTNLAFSHPIQIHQRSIPAARKKACVLMEQPDIDFKTFQRRLGEFLQRRGFGYDVVTRIVRELWRD